VPATVFIGFLLHAERFKPKEPITAKSMKVIPICSDTILKRRQQEVVDLAFEYWLARFGVRYGFPEEDLWRAEREVAARSSRARGRTARIFLVRGSGP
jgi:hypothetical protein